MTTTQLSVFLENRPGTLADVTKLFDDNDINIRALSLADTQDFGILRLIVDDFDKTGKILKDAGIVFTITQVLTVEVPDKPGAFYNIVKMLGEYNVNLEYSYASTARKEGFAYMIIRADNTDKAIEILSKNSVKLICQSEIHDLFR